MDASEALAAIRRIAAADDGRVFLSEHAKFRGPEAGKKPLTKQEIVSILTTGLIDEGPAPDIRVAGGWKFRMRRSYDKQTFYVAGVLVPATGVFVMTGYEDRPRVPDKRRPSAGGIGGDGRDTE